MAPFAFKGAVDGEIIEICVWQFLVRGLRESDVLMMDNLTAHKRLESG